MATNYIFVYGTLMTGMENHHLVKPYVKAVTRACIKGRLYHLTYGYPALIEEEGRVQGELLEIHSLDRALKILDELEDYFGPGHSDNLYHRVVRPVERRDGLVVEAYVYVWARPDELDDIGIPVPHGNWRQMIQRTLVHEQFVFGK